MCLRNEPHDFLISNIKTLAKKLLVVDPEKVTRSKKYKLELQLQSFLRYTQMQKLIKINSSSGIFKTIYQNGS